MFPYFKEVVSFTPPKVVFGVNAVDKLGEHIKEIVEHGQKAFLVSDPVLSKVGITERVKKALEKEGWAVAVWDQCKEEPDDLLCDEAATIARKEKCGFVVALGGGSNIDLAKVVAELIVLGGKTIDYLQQGVFPKKGAPIITVVTTSGTGSEVTMYSVISHSKDKVKGCFGSPTVNILASMALVDPTLTLTMPPRVTAGTGIDALSHAIECVISKKENPLSDAIAYQAIAYIGEALPAAVYEGDNLQARVKMSYGSMMAGLAFNDTGTVEGHAFAHSLGCVYHVPHGIGCGIATPYTMEYNIGHAMDKLARIAEALGVNTRGMSRRQAAQASVYAVKQLLEDVGLPTTWAAYGKKEDIPRLSALMLGDMRIAGMFGGAKRGMMSKNAAEELFLRSYEGRLGEAICW
jgi:alcohol dehydrogenase class IV